MLAPWRDPQRQQQEFPAAATGIFGLGVLHAFGVLLNRTPLSHFEGYTNHFFYFFLCFLVYPKIVHPYRILEGYTNKWGTPMSFLQQEFPAGKSESDSC